MKEQGNYEAIKSLVDHGGNKNRVVVELGVTRRTVDRMVAGYRAIGKDFFSHGSKGRKPVTALTDEDKKRIIDLYNMKYYDASYQFFAELLASEEGIHVSVSTIRNILLGEYILSPKAKRATKKRVKEELEAKLEEPISKKRKSAIELKIIDIEFAHPRRPRCANFGEELQMDASKHNWFGSEYSHLHAAIDDATGRLTGMYFEREETLKGYYNVFSQTLKTYGIPYKFRTDRRTVFEYKMLGSTKTEEDTFTQFAYACKQLGVHLETTSVPEGKARIERVFGTLQGRLPILFRLAGIATIEAANEFLNSYINEFNAQFALDHNAIPSVFEKQPSDEKINLTLSVLTERTVDSGHSLRFDNKYYRTIDLDSECINLAKGTKGLVIKALDGSFFFTAADTVMALEEIPFRDAVSQEFPEAPAPKEKKSTKQRYIPPMDHPWRAGSFGKFCRKMRHRSNLPSAG
jgi:transposase